MEATIFAMMLAQYIQTHGEPNTSVIDRVRANAKREIDDVYLHGRGSSWLAKAHVIHTYRGMMSDPPTYLSSDLKLSEAVVRAGWCAR